LPEKLEESPWAKVFAVIAGAGASDLVQGQVQKAVPQVGGEMAGAGAGVIAYLYGDKVHPLVKWLGIGIMAGSLSPRLKGYLGGLAPATGALAGTGTGAPKNAASAAAQAYIAGKR